MTGVRVVGAGLSGLTTAWRLTEAGITVDIVESTQRPGGLIETMSTPYGPVERAANAFVWSPSVERLFRSLDLTPRFAGAASRRRYIFRDGRPRRWPLRFGETCALAWRAAVAMATGRSKPFGRETVVAWANRAWGPAATRWLISPALQGLYAAPADELAAAAIVGGTAPMVGRRRPSTIAAPAGGMSDLVNRLVEKLRERGTTFTFGARIDSLDPSIPTVVATSARAAAPLVQPHAPALAAALAALPMTTLGLATAVFPPHDGDVHGFGVLFPRGCGINALGVRFDSDIFPVDTDRTWRTETWIVRMDVTGAEPPDAGAWWRTVAADRRALTGRSDEPVEVVTTFRPHALPVYGSGVLDVRDRLAELPPWLALAGNYMGRLGASKLLDVADDAAARLDRRLQAMSRRSASAIPV